MRRGIQLTSEALRARAERYLQGCISPETLTAEFIALAAEAQREQVEKDRQILVHGVSLPVVGAAIHELLHTRANGQPAEPFGECSDAHCAEDIVAATSVLGHAIAALRAQTP